MQRSWSRLRRLFTRPIGIRGTGQTDNKARRRRLGAKLPGREIGDLDYLLHLYNAKNCKKGETNSGWLRSFLRKSLDRGVYWVHSNRRKEKSIATILDADKKIQVISPLAHGSNIRSTVREA